MNIEYTVTHCYRKDYDDERWDVLARFDRLEDAIEYDDEHSSMVEDGFLFITVEWCTE